MITIHARQEKKGKIFHRIDHLGEVCTARDYQGETYYDMGTAVWVETEGWERTGNDISVTPDDYGLGGHHISGPSVPAVILRTEMGARGTALSEAIRLALVIKQESLFTIWATSSDSTRKISVYLNRTDQLIGFSSGSVYLVHSDGKDSKISKVIDDGLGASTKAMLLQDLKRDLGLSLMPHHQKVKEAFFRGASDQVLQDYFAKKFLDSIMIGGVKIQEVGTIRRSEVLKDFQPTLAHFPTVAEKALQWLPLYISEMEINRSEKIAIVQMLQRGCIKRCYSVYPYNRRCGVYHVC